MTTRIAIARRSHLFKTDMDCHFISRSSVIPMVSGRSLNGIAPMSRLARPLHIKSFYSLLFPSSRRL